VNLRFPKFQAAAPRLWDNFAFSVAPFGRVCGVDLIKNPRHDRPEQRLAPPYGVANRLQGSAKPTGSSSYDGSYAVFSCVCELQFCDAYAFYHKACQYILNK